MSRMTLFLCLANLFAGLCSLFIGAADLSLDSLWQQGQPRELFVLSRLPRLLALWCTGAGMSVAGLLMQQLCANRFVSPSTGATIASAQFGILLALLFVPESGLVSRALFSFVAAIAGTWTFVALVARLSIRDVVMVPLIGIMFGNIITGVTQWMAFRFDMTQTLSTWLTGHFSLVMQGNYELICLTLPLIVLAWVFARHFNIVGMGRDISTNLGLSYNTLLFFGLTLAAMITASIVCVVGAVSYVGLIIPNIVSLYRGDDVRGVLPDTVLLGMLFVLCCDVLARSVIAPYELPVELIIGIVGSFIFVGLIFWRLHMGNRGISRRTLAALLGLNQAGQEQPVVSGGKKC